MRCRLRVCESSSYVFVCTLNPLITQQENPRVYLSGRLMRKAQSNSKYGDVSRWETDDWFLLLVSPQVELRSGLAMGCVFAMVAMDLSSPAEQLGAFRIVR
jgi:hypothetical protein